MKKIFLFLMLTVSAVLVLPSCNSDDDNGGGSSQNKFSANINGEQKNFTSVNVVVKPYTDYTDLEITATIANPQNTKFELNLTRDTGEVFFVQFSENDQYYQTALGDLDVIITENTSNKIKGTFSGVLRWTNDPSVTIPVTAGVFDISY